MSNFPLESVERTVGSKYTAVVVVARRALDAAKRFLTLRASRRNPIAWAMREVVEGRVQVEVPSVEEATAESIRLTPAERLRVGFIHEEDLEMEAERMALHKEFGPEAVEPEAEEEEEEELEAQGLHEEEPEAEAEEEEQEEGLEEAEEEAVEEEAAEEEAQEEPGS